MSECNLIALGLTQRDDGVLVVPADAIVTFTPTGAFYELRVSLDGNVISAVLSKTALKVGREAQQTKAATSSV